jgi:hypothetical protein
MPTLQGHEVGDLCVLEGFGILIHSADGVDDLGGTPFRPSGDVSVGQCHLLLTGLV